LHITYTQREKKTSDTRHQEGKKEKETNINGLRHRFNINTLTHTHVWCLSRRKAYSHLSSSFFVLLGSLIAFRWRAGDRFQKIEKMRTLLLLRREWREKTTRERLVKKSLKKEMPIAPTAGWRCAVQYDYAQSLTKAVEKLSIKEKEKRDIANVLLLLARFTAHRPTARSCSASVFSTGKKCFSLSLIVSFAIDDSFFPALLNHKTNRKKKKNK